MGCDCKKHKKHIQFIEANHLNPKGNTCVWQVVAENSVHLGWIKWKKEWRQYCFFPAEETLYNSGCMEDIAEFMKENRKTRK